jgi:hypothetical protein
MSNKGRYRRAYPRLFRHPGFTRLTQLGQRLVCYLLWGPQSNRIGLFHFSVTMAAEDLKTTAETLKGGLVEVASSFGWTFDAGSRVFYIPSWWRWNPPDHIHILEGNLKDLSEIPPCGLVDAFLTNLEHLTPKLHGTFVEACGIRLAKASGDQDQDQDQKQEQKRRAPRGSDGNVGNGKPMSKLVETARTTLELVNPQAPIEDLVDAFGSIHREPCTKAQAIEALNTALHERRR